MRSVSRAFREAFREAFNGTGIGATPGCGGDGGAFPNGVWSRPSQRLVAGAGLALIARSKRTEAQDIADRTHYIELSADESFEGAFARATEPGEVERLVE